ncbi:Yip1 domain protein [Ruminiclostridium hungatei]|uniref:Yip1 domain protein n=1 Tax=Ruminiclostridium hungatei TaxID=48256 RepID=A0A1V4SQU1_RUMHU|nr:Yip1 family protein [Ruminiclostridium hungatei]OPX46232.1 Yip1 domain protein [Ruminiclostridium hungatei]
MNDNLVSAAQENVLPKLNVFQRIIYTVTSPEKLMLDLERKPRVLLGILLTILTPMLTMFAAFPMFKEYMRGTLEATGAYAELVSQMSAEQVESVLVGSAISTPVFAGIGAGIVLLVEALVIWLVLKIFKGQARFKQILSVLGYAAVISVLAAIVSIIAINVTGAYTDVTYTSLASLLPEMKGTFAFGFARTIDVFGIWAFVVSTIGIATVSKIDKKKVYVIMACIFIILAVYMGYNEVKAASLLN